MAIKNNFIIEINYCNSKSINISRNVESHIIYRIFFKTKFYLNYRIADNFFPLNFFYSSVVAE